MIKDITNCPLEEGDNVVYAPYGMGNSVALARVEKIYADKKGRIKVGLRRVNADFTIERAPIWDSATKSFLPYESGKPLSLVTTEYRQDKFYKIK